jgi:pimeloyl-ACP methyl ester carboxylesterase
MTNVIQQLSVHTGSDSIRLVGYSGGGTLAVLLSDRITSVTEVITIAAPLDLKAWAHLRGASPPKASLDPIQHHKPGGASGITRYLHLVGGRDPVVPIQQAVAYSARFPEEHFRTFPLYDHVCCWVRDWPNLLQDITEH